MISNLGREGKGRDGVGWEGNGGEGEGKATDGKARGGEVRDGKGRAGKNRRLPFITSAADNEKEIALDLCGYVNTKDGRVKTAAGLDWLACGQTETERWSSRAEPRRAEPSRAEPSRPFHSKPSAAHQNT